jgi:hypothetical protein
MKKTGKVLVASLLVVGLLTLSFSLAFAMAAPASTELVDPVVKPALSGEKYTSLVLTPQFLPGTFEKDGLLYPKGFGPSQGQFSGSGIKISGLKAGETVSLSFDYKLYNFKWAGAVYSWNGTKWVKLATKTVLPTGDETMTWATVSGVGNGTYALIVGNYGLPPTEVPTEVPTELPTEPPFLD